MISTGEESVPVALCPPQILHGMTCYGMRFSAEKGLTTNCQNPQVKLSLELTDVKI
jgi:hypothetical protein